MVLFRFQSVLQHSKRISSPS